MTPATLPSQPTAAAPLPPPGAVTAAEALSFARCTKGRGSAHPAHWPSLLPAQCRKQITTMLDMGKAGHL